MTARDLKNGLDLTGLFEEERFWEAFCWNCKASDEFGECPTGGDAWDEHCPRHRAILDIEQTLEGAMVDIGLTMSEW